MKRRNFLQGLLAAVGAVLMPHPPTIPAPTPTPVPNGRPGPIPTRAETVANKELPTATPRPPRQATVNPYPEPELPATPTPEASPYPMLRVVEAWDDGDQHHAICELDWGFESCTTIWPDD